MKRAVLKVFGHVLARRAALQQIGLARPRQLIEAGRRFHFQNESDLTGQRQRRQVHRLQIRAKLPVRVQHVAVHLPLLFLLFRRQAAAASGRRGRRRGAAGAAPPARPAVPSNALRTYAIRIPASGKSGFHLNAASATDGSCLSGP